LNEVLDSKVESLQLQGGEVFLDGRIGRIFDVIRAKGNPCISIITNGIELQRWIMRMEGAVRHLTVSLDASRPETYNRLHQSHRFFDVIDSVRRVKATGDIHVSLKMMVVQSNMNEVESFYTLARAIGVDEVAYTPYGAVAGSEDFTKEESLSESQTQQVVQSIRALPDEGVSLDLYSPFSDKTQCSVRCSKPWDSVLVDVSGNVKICCRNSFSIGNLNTQSLQEILGSQALKSIQDSFERREYAGCMASCRSRV
jgi:MoaA/NifB/PqqE/SkfB family radical SAM enzyme